MSIKFQYPTCIGENRIQKNKIILGTAALGGVWGTVSETESIDAILLALDNNINVMDTAPAYSRAEEFLGKALKEWKGKKPFVNTKAGRLKGETAEVGHYDYTPESLKRSVNNSLNTLGLDFLNVCFLHDMENCPINMRETALETLQQLKQEGIIKKIGLGGKMDINWYNYIDKKYIDVVMNYNRLNACNMDGMIFDIPLYKSKNIEFYSASILHMGLLGRRFDEMVKDKPDWISEKDIRNATSAQAIAQKYQMTLATLAHRFAFSIAETNHIVIGAKNPTELKQTLKDWELAKLPNDIFNELIYSIL